MRSYGSRRRDTEVGAKEVLECVCLDSGLVANQSAKIGVEHFLALDTHEACLELEEHRKGRELASRSCARAEFPLKRGVEVLDVTGTSPDVRRRAHDAAFTSEAHGYLVEKARR
jgi:hypothetical protein